MTITEPTIIQQMLENDGVYPGDPRAAIIYSYQAVSEQAHYAVFMDYAHDDMFESPYVRKPVVLWTHTHGLTEAGKNWLFQQKHQLIDKDDPELGCTCGCSPHEQCESEGCPHCTYTKS